MKNETTYYHGTDEDFNEFSLDNYGANSTFSAVVEPAIYTTNSREHAERYSGLTGWVISVNINTSNYEKIDGDALLKEVYGMHESYQDEPFDVWMDGLSDADIYEVLHLDDYIGHEARNIKALGWDGIVFSAKDLEIVLSFNPMDIKIISDQ